MEAKNSWGDGSSSDKTNYPISVEPDTEYVLTGSIKVSGSGCYWAGARVAGKEIYCVAATDSSYTDTTDTDSKLAAAVNREQRSGHLLRSALPHHLM